MSSLMVQDWIHMQESEQQSKPEPTEDAPKRQMPQQPDADKRFKRSGVQKQK